MIITINGRSQQTPSAKGGKGKIQQLDRVSCPDMEIWVLPNLGIAMDRVSCPDTNIKVLTTRFPWASCFKETHAFCSRNMGVHVQCTCAKKLVSSNFAKIMYNYVRKKNMLSRLAISGNVWGGSTSSDVLAVHNYDPKKKRTVFWKKTYSGMAIGGNDIYIQLTFTADAFRKRRKRENSTVGPGFMSWHGDSSFA